MANFFKKRKNERTTKKLKNATKGLCKNFDIPEAPTETLPSQEIVEISNNTRTAASSKKTPLEGLKEKMQASGQYVPENQTPLPTTEQKRQQLIKKHREEFQQKQEKLRTHRQTTRDRITASINPVTKTEEEEYQQSLEKGASAWRSTE